MYASLRGLEQMEVEVYIKIMYAFLEMCGVWKVILCLFMLQYLGAGCVIVATNVQPSIMFNESTLLFSTYLFLAHPIIYLFFTKMLMRFLDFRIWIEFSFIIWKKWVFHQFRFYNLKTSKNRTRSFLFLDYRIWTPSKHPFLGWKQFRLYDLNCININSEYVCNIDNQFKDHINLLNSHPSVLGHYC